MNWYLKVLKEHYINFSGRARRKEYWMFTLINMIMGGAAFYIDLLASKYVFDTQGAIYSLYSLAVMLPSVGVFVRRLQDTGKSWLWVLLLLLPIIGWGILLIWLLKDSTPGENKFGPNPKEEIIQETKIASSTDK